MGYAGILLFAILGFSLPTCDGFQALSAGPRITLGSSAVDSRASPCFAQSMPSIQALNRRSRACLRSAPASLPRMSGSDMSADHPDEETPIFLKGSSKTEVLTRPLITGPSMAQRAFVLLKKARTNTTTLAGILCIMGTERLAFHLSNYYGLGFPSAPLGMVLIFIAMTLLQATSESLTLRTLIFFGPAREFYKLWVPLFFSAPLVDLPLALKALPVDQVAKILLVITAGTFLTLLSTAAIVTPLLSSPDTKGAAPSNSAPPAAAPKTTVTLTRPTPWRLEFFALGVSLACFVAGLVSPAVVALSVAALQLGKTLPPKVRGVLPPIVTGALLVCASLCARGLAMGTGWVSALTAYRAPGGPGLILLSQAPPAVVALGFGLFEQRRLLVKRWVPIVGGGVVTTFVSLVSTVFLARIVGLSKPVCLGLAPRFITLPIALPIAETLGAASAVTAMAVVLEGIIGANFGFSLLNMFRVSDPVARGISIGASSHALGTAQAYSDEPESGPSSAVTFLLCGILASCLVQVPPVRALLLAAATVK